MPFNPTKHHRRSIRLRGYDYSQAGLYFVTICCENREHLFGRIENNEMKLNDAGKIANDYWMEIPEHFPNAVLHEYIVMPNHVHGIIELANDVIVGAVGAGAVGAGAVGAENFLPLQNQNQQHQHTFQKIIPRSIASIVKGYKIGVTKWVRNNSNIQKVWQRNYHEHIIRNEQSYKTISDYIIKNPSKWDGDKFNTR